MRFCRALLAGALVLTAGLTFANRAHAGGDEVPFHLAKPKEIKLDGVLRDWGGTPLTHLGYRIQGSAGGASMRGALAYDSKYIYVAGSVKDPKFTRTNAFRSSEDHAELLLSFPNARGRYGKIYRVGLYPGDPGKTAGQVKAAAGAVGTAKIIEAPVRGGYTFEARIPWSLFPPASRVRVALRGALRYYDSNGQRITGIVGTADKGSAASLPLLPTAPEQSLRQGLLRQKGLRSRPAHRFLANVAGGRMHEQVLVYDRFLAVLGPRFRGGTEYFWSDLGVDASGGGLPMFEVRDVTGDGKAEIILRKRLPRGEGWRELLQILAFGNRGKPRTLFEHETGISSSKGTIQNEVEIVSSGVKVSLGTSTGYSSATYNEPQETARASLLLPWGTVRSRTFTWDGTDFKVSSEAKKKAGDTPSSGGSAASRPAAPPPPQAPRPPTADELLDKVFALYRKDHNISAKAPPRFDFVTNVAEDEQNERIVCHGRDLVVFGKGFKRGLGYSSMTMAQFASGKDVFDVTARDLTGDGRADILVRGIQRAEAPEELGKGELIRETFFVYSVSSSRIGRIFAVETAVSLDGNRIQSTLSFLAGHRGLEIAVLPGRAVGWDRRSWPFKQGGEPISGVQPLVLPWSTESVRYRFDGSAFVR